MSKVTKAIVGVAGGICAAGAAAFAYGVIEARAFTVRRVDVPVLPAGQRPLRVLHISDIHLLARQGKKLDFLSALAGLEPDLVINTGDNVSSGAAIQPLLKAFGRLLDMPGVFVFGSNDYRAPVMRNPLSYLNRTSKSDDKGKRLPYLLLKRRLSASGWHYLAEQSVVLEIDGRRVEIRGTDDAHSDRDRYWTVAGPGEPDADVRIGVTHAPYLRVLDSMTVDDVGLVLAGHTHGGQVCVPGLGAVVTNCDLPPSRAKGLSIHRGGQNNAYLHVSEGIGTSPYAPFRVACRPAATLLTLVPKAGSTS